MANISNNEICTWVIVGKVC